ncbi:UNVERIFIED_CONTAM: hypothetical protein Slati_3535500 [Sesamum latifolium]|uniref:Uncharacterized protein n=1 Tax=Sesamum latifolium TaxID=2727402 RepID=A0AAW2UIQ4_9LAMI
MQAGSMISLSPSFNSYSNTKLAEIAARVVEEFDSEELYDEFYFEREESSAAGRVEEEGVSVEGDRGNDVVTEGDADEDDEEFEFAFVTRDSELPSPISADEIFHNGQIRPVYPVFNRDLFLGDVDFRQGNGKENGVQNSGSEKGPTIRLPLRKLFIEERETTMTMTTTSSSSSSEADDLGEFRLIHTASHSDGSKDRFVLLSPSNSGRKKENVERVKATAGSPQKAKPAAPPPPPPPLPPPALYGRDGGEKRRSYLPYRQDLVGFFANVNGLSKNLQPF